MFEKSKFIKPDVIFDPGNKSYAPMFRKEFWVEGDMGQTTLHVCGLGFGYYYLNGKRVSDDLFTAPVSDYTKTLWYVSYDVTHLLQKGKNVFAAVCGNGWYNEGLSTSWNFDRALWRDVPKLMVSMDTKDGSILLSDGSWKCICDPAVVYNQLRSGEHFDSRLYMENWMMPEFSSQHWPNAIEDEKTLQGVFRQCPCEPIREIQSVSPTEIRKIGDQKYVFDFGENKSGYVRITVNQPSGDEILIEYAEQIYEDGTRRLNNMDNHYHTSAFQTDRLICCGKEITWSPRFVYHGFRYAVITGIRDPEKFRVSQVVVHQAVKTRSSFCCSEEKVSRLFKLGQNATLSNLFYAPTDCPTREKLGWMNDAQASAHQMLTDFETERLFEKWFTDICDAMKEDGQLPGIVPTGGWGYEWGNGPVSDGALFEIPYRVYLHTGKDALLKEGLPFFRRYLAYLENRKNENGELDFGLNDWAAPEKDNPVSAAFINGVLYIKFLWITGLAMERCNENTDSVKKQIEREKEKMICRYINRNGRCVIEKQTAVAMLLYFEIYREKEPLSGQLKELVEAKNFHHDCGMVGLRYLYTALDKCGLSEYAFRILCAEGYPSYMDWLKDGATSLYEMWDMEESKNHHMYSHFMAWLVNTILGIKPDIRYPGFRRVDISPFFPEKLTWAKGFCHTVNGTISVSWERTREGIRIQIQVPENIDAYYRGKRLDTGTNIYVFS